MFAPSTLRFNSRIASTRILFLALAAVPALAAHSQIAPSTVQSAEMLAAQYFQEARVVCESDAAKLWRVSLCGPLLFADPQTRAIYASQADKDGTLRADGGVFRGTLPANVNIANTSLTC